MYNSRLTKILKTFSKNEIRELAKFVSAPCFNTRQDVTALYHYFAKHHGDTPLVFEKEKIYATLFPQKKYDDALMRGLIHSLQKVLKAYLVYKELETDETESQIFLARAMKRRGLDDFFEKELAVAEAVHKNQSFRHARFHYRNYLLREEELEHANLLRRQGQMPIADWSKELTTFFAAESLRQACVAFSYRIMGEAVVIPLIDEVVALVEKGFFEKNTEGGQTAGTPNPDGLALKVYYNTYKALTTQNTLYFNALKHLIFEHRYQFPDNEIRIVYLLAINFCIKKMNKGELEFREEVFELYEKGLANRALFENGFLSKFTFKNLVSVGIMLKKYDWVKDFIETARMDLPAKDRASAYSFNRAVLHFRQGDYAHAMTLLQNADMNDKLTDFDSRVMLLRIYFETDAVEALMSLTESFATFLNRQKSLGYQKDSYLNLIKMVRKMMRQNLRDKKVRDRLIQEINDTSYLAEREWLLERLMS
jgi:hypothetical protein